MPEIIGSIVAYNPHYQMLHQVITTFIESASDSSVIVCDNSPADSISQNLKTDFGDKVFYQKAPGNIGYGSGHNLNFKVIVEKSTYFCILNPDIEIPKSTIPKLLSFQKLHPQYELLSGGVFNFDGSPQNLHKYILSFKEYVQELLARKWSFITAPISYPKDLNYQNPTPFRIPVMSGCFMLFTNKHYRELGGFNEKFFMYFEDYDLSLRSFAMSKSILLPTVPIYHHWARASHKQLKLLLAHLKSAFIFYSLWGFIFHPLKLLNKQAGPIMTLSEGAKNL